jgi:hypothetical protein
MEWETFGHHKVSAAIPAAAPRIGEGSTWLVGEGLKPAGIAGNFLMCALQMPWGQFGTSVLHRLCRIQGMLVPNA